MNKDITDLKAALVTQVISRMQDQQISKTRMTEAMRPTRTQLDQLLDPSCIAATLETVARAAPVDERPHPAGQGGEEHCKEPVA